MQTGGEQKHVMMLAASTQQQIHNPMDYSGTVPAKFVKRSDLGKINSTRNSHLSSIP